MSKYFSAVAIDSSVESILCDVEEENLFLLVDPARNVKDDYDEFTCGLRIHR